MALIDRPKEYPGIDGFRLAAALLIVAIHTDPLACFGTEANLVLTRILARVGVPFFFMVTGFFVLPKTNDARPDQARRFLKKTLLLYIASTLLYLPVQWYKGVFAQSNLAGTISKDLLFEGTFYHLWYLPAVLLGVIVLLLSLIHI